MVMPPCSWQVGCGLTLGQCLPQAPNTLLSPHWGLWVTKGSPSPLPRPLYLPSACPSLAPSPGYQLGLVSSSRQGWGPYPCESGLGQAKACGCCAMNMSLPWSSASALGAVW